ncbi:hypothetical protein A3H26_02390 [candidate division WWE3 bacterium RIFCSPLOWO2_12_FULL_36_10]|uniref:Protein kinase domain-containing protein n=1 Tax=candidate division WWE3 bacterium RIFCSPLOWO2_12_FULL_36_10 TaxID=1802630 RepID=A0A1F4VJ68_UNCKA|nr:MAG: hypothetical protein A3H26_02390 [candidate division WWE3 bacterium RIFCSPLOWO2_12_FULL_36_10]
MGERFVPEEIVNSTIQEGRTEIPKEKLEQKRYVAPNELWIKDTHLRKPVIPPKPDETLPRKGADGLIKTSYLDLLRDGAVELTDNRWRIDSLLSEEEGVYGKVYRAFDTKLKIPVALKVGRHIDGTFEIEREAKAMANINHPGVIKIYDFTIQNAPDGRGLPIIVEEYMDPNEAPTLFNKLKKEGKLGASDIRKVIAELSETVDYLYFDKGILHNDLKPANIFLDRRFTKIGDFGISNSANKNGGGTRAYNAPERKFPRTKNTLQGEVFSLGIIAYEMLTNAIPLNDNFDAEYKSEYLETPEMERKYGKERLERSRDVLIKALSIKPEDRYQTATEFAQALEEALKED